MNTRFLYKIFWLPFYRFWALRHIQKDQICHLEGLKLWVPMGVFHPKVYFSTPIFLKFLTKIPFLNKKTIDLGTGTGAIALFAARRGAAVVAVDINPKAVEAAAKNAQTNGLALEVFESDLFDAVPAGERFDFVLVNPPYYPKVASQVSEHAFFAGSNHEYFEKLFAQLPIFCHRESKIFMILSEDCDWAVITAVATRFGQRLEKVFEQKKWGEQLFVAEVYLPNL